jgi:hypothetical protein
MASCSLVKASTSLSQATPTHLPVRIVRYSHTHRTARRMNEHGATRAHQDNAQTQPSVDRMCSRIKGVQDGRALSCGIPTCALRSGAQPPSTHTFARACRHATRRGAEPSGRCTGSNFPAWKASRRRVHQTIPSPERDETFRAHVQCASGTRKRPCHAAYRV